MNLTHSFWFLGNFQYFLHCIANKCRKYEEGGRSVKKTWVTEFYWQWNLFQARLASYLTQKIRIWSGSGAIIELCDKPRLWTSTKKLLLFQFFKFPGNIQLFLWKISNHFWALGDPLGSITARSQLYCKSQGKVNTSAVVSGLWRKNAREYVNKIWNFRQREKDLSSTGREFCDMIFCINRKVILE